jgi:hypothetical protein
MSHPFILEYVHYVLNPMAPDLTSPRDLRSQVLPRALHSRVLQASEYF